MGGIPVSLFFETHCSLSREGEKEIREGALPPPTHLGDPGDVSGDAGEDCGLLGLAALDGPEANNAVDLPLVADAAVQGASGVALRIEKPREGCPGGTERPLSRPAFGLLLLLPILKPFVPPIHALSWARGGFPSLKGAQGDFSHRVPRAGEVEAGCHSGADWGILLLKWGSQGQLGLLLCQPPRLGCWRPSQGWWSQGGASSALPAPPPQATRGQTPDVGLFSRGWQPDPRGASSAPSPWPASPPLSWGSLVPPPPAGSRSGPSQQPTDPVGIQRQPELLC